MHPRYRLYLLFALLVVLIAGCLTDKPLSDPEASEIDTSLLGVWVGVSPDGNQKSHYFVGKHQQESNPKGLLEFIGISQDLGKSTVRHMTGDATPNIFYCSTTIIGKQRFLNLFLEEGMPANLHAPNSYATWVRSATHSCQVKFYEVSGDTLTIYHIDEAKIKQAIRDGILKSSPNQQSIVSAQSLASHISKNGAGDLINLEKMVLERSK